MLHAVILRINKTKRYAIICHSEQKITDEKFMDRRKINQPSFLPTMKTHIQYVHLFEMISTIFILIIISSVIKN